jgi:hypothetical protein
MQQSYTIPNTICNASNSSISRSTNNTNANKSNKKGRKIRFAPTGIVYAFFGEDNVKVPKIIALRVLEFLNGKELFHV